MQKPVQKGTIVFCGFIIILYFEGRHHIYIVHKDKIVQRWWTIEKYGLVELGWCLTSSEAVLRLFTNAFVQRHTRYCPSELKKVFKLAQWTWRDLRQTITSSCYIIMYKYKNEAPQFVFGSWNLDMCVLL